jgi:hypothetical protein
VRSMCHEAARGPNGRYYRNNGVWHDQLRRSGDDRVFTHRTYQYLWLDLSPFRRPIHVPPAGTGPGFTRRRHDHVLRSVSEAGSEPIAHASVMALARSFVAGRAR